MLINHLLIVMAQDYLDSRIWNEKYNFKIKKTFEDIVEMKSKSSLYKLNGQLKINKFDFPNPSDYQVLVKLFYSILWQPNNGNIWRKR